MTTYHTAAIDGLRIFYREAGPRDGPTILLLHGFPSSSRMFDPLIPLLADRYHLVAPDYPGFGHSDAPAPDAFTYSFDHLAEVVDRLTAALGLARYVLFVQDYGGPVGFRLALTHPERVRAIIVQNAVSHEEGLGLLWETRKAYWADRSSNEAKLRTNLTSLEATRQRHLGTSPHPEKYDPDTWTDSPSYRGPAKRKSRASSSMTTAPTSLPTPVGRRGCASTSRRFSFFGAYTTRPLPRRAPRHTSATCRAPRSISSMPAISRSTKRVTRSPR
jgi:pimeloyl-ACP methyl ester carboxylesterase